MFQFEVKATRTGRYKSGVLLHEAASRADCRILTTMFYSATDGKDNYESCSATRLKREFKAITKGLRRTGSWMERTFAELPLTKFFCSIVDRKIALQVSANALDGLPTYGALRCLCDEIRTAKFLDAVNARVLELAGRRNGIIKVVDAGCGPFPILAIQAALSSPIVKVVAVECNPRSAAMARSVVSRLGLENQITVVECNALDMRFSGAIDLIVSETFTYGLTAEGGHLILPKLSKCLAKDGYIIPQAVTLSLGVCESSLADCPSNYINVEPFAQRRYDLKFPIPRVDLSAEDVDKHLKPRLEDYAPMLALLLGTEFELTDSESLHPNQSFITMLTKVVGLNEKVLRFPLNETKSVRVNYKPGTGAAVGRAEMLA